MINKSGIYSITNTITGKKYIGSAVNITQRWRVHLTLLRLGKHHSIKLQRSWNKHGKEAFVFSVIEIVENLHSLISREQHYIDSMDTFINGYNVSPTAGSTLGRIMDEHQKKELSRKATGRKHSDEAKKKMSESRLGVKRGPMAETTKAKIAKAKLGHRASEETKKKMSNAHKGKKHSEEHRAKLTIANRARAAKKLSNETRHKMSESAKKRVCSNPRNELGQFYTFGAEHDVKFTEPIEAMR